MPLAEKAAGVAGFMVGGPPGAMAARKGVAAGRYGLGAAKKANAARKDYAEAKNAKEKHNSPSVKCEGKWKELYELVAARERLLDRHPLSHPGRAEKSREFKTKIDIAYDELMACECRENRCRR
ncbi:MAG: hypothetical protein UY48_C0013G0012 [Candidatus Gottesmanbacteria bacterium GW2011_GWB1_49_7]|uniref:Uncharacterized protein n=1 Tax=Candidatus Gottesmanbacteria bacterium GW2011_GWB1_49_7 TaxID=1618448 RepID=A0A0G1VZ43_9BACT|nr:MAG: hypothetical protein UY48_C0013G0012 [Candidatus Gottesmanbacteria bacterium GW2011_GWB1_49_7]